MPKYFLKKDHYLGDRLHKAGTETDWDGPPSLSMQPLDAAAEAAKKNWDADRKQRQNRGRKSLGWSPALKAHEWAKLERADPSLGDEPPMANINVIGKPKRARATAPEATV